MLTRTLRRLGNPETFLVKDMKRTVSPITTTLPDLKGVAFGSLFAPRQIHVDWSKQNGWEAPEMKDFGEITMPIQASALHYGLQCFEGMKAYRAADGSVRLFRPDMNAARMKRSMASLGFPGFDEKEWIQLVKEFVKANESFVPNEEDFTLYIRPAAIATNQNLRVAPSDRVKLFIIGSPVGPYYPDGFKPVKLWVDKVHKRAWPGGSGEFKVGPNYGPTIGHSVEAASRGFPQVLWLGPNEEINEVGAMNFMVLWKNKNGERELITPNLDGTILPGVTRNSILTMAREWGEFKVTETTFYLNDVVEALKEGRVEEMFGCGTAAIVTTVEGLHLPEQEFSVPLPPPEKSVAHRVLKNLNDITYGRIEHPWSVKVE